MGSYCKKLTNSVVDRLYQQDSEYFQCGLYLGCFLLLSVALFILFLGSLVGVAVSGI